MNNIDFAHLHLHSEYSLLDGACRFDKVIEKALKYNIKAVALTDHGNMFGVIDFYKSAKKAGIKPIIGCEFYVAGKSRFEKEPQNKETSYHLILLAKNQNGYKNLIKLCSLGFTEGFYYKPRIDSELLKQYSQDLICFTACLKGLIPVKILQDDKEGLREAIEFYLDLFTRENLYFELMDHGLTEQKIVNRELLKLSEKYKINVVATNDCHYIDRSDARYHDILLCIQTGKNVNSSDRLKFTGNEFYFKTPEEMAKVFADVPDAISNTIKIAEMCDVEIDFNQKLYPDFIPPDNLSPDDYLKKLAHKGFEEKYPRPSKELQERLEYELSTINKMGYNTYFLVVWDLVRFAKENGIPVGPGRGSAAGSIVSYCLGITALDPISHNLLFERFLNPERVSPPDIDIDFCYEQRDKVIQYVKQKYGENNVAQIVTFGTMKAKNAIRDVGRTLGMAYGDVDKIAKMIPETLNITIKESLDINLELKSAYESSELIRELIDSAMALEGMVRHSSTHAAGVVISSQNLMEIIPIYKIAKDNDIATQYHMKNVEEIGLLKMDFLGLKTLTIINNTLKILKQNRNIDFDISSIKLDDKKTYKLLQEGKTMAVFQLESSGMRDIVKRLTPSSFEDITALLALYRPGPLGSGMVDDFVKRKHGGKKIVYDHPILESILKETYGVIVYQEQVAQIARAMGGFTLGQADILRRAMGKKKPEEMHRMRNEFIEKAVDNKIDKAIAEKVFDLMSHFAGYGFNKSHSAAYAMISYQTAYLKAHYPVEFMAAVLTNEKANIDNVVKYIGECKEMGIQILPPDVNESNKDFTVVGDAIRFGLCAIKNVGETAVESIISAREGKGRYESLQDFFEKNNESTISSRVIESLIKSGAFDSLSARRSQLFKAYPQILEIIGKNKKEKETGQTSLFDALDVKSPFSMSKIELPDIPEWEEKEILQYEKDSLGFYVSRHPLEKYTLEIRYISNASSKMLGEKKDGDEVVLCGLVTKKKEHFDKKGNKMLFVTLEDFEGSTELVVFSNALKKYNKEINEEDVLCVAGKIDTSNDKTPKLLVDQIYSINNIIDNLTSSININIRTELFDDKSLEKIMSIIKKNPGKKKITFSFLTNDVNKLVYELNNEFGISINAKLIKSLEKVVEPEDISLSI